MTEESILEEMRHDLWEHVVHVVDDYLKELDFPEDRHKEIWAVLHDRQAPLTDEQIRADVRWAIKEVGFLQ